jgi:hypothetical protein
VERLAELGLTKPDKTGSVVYYDIEHYGTESSCRTAANAFMNGWVSQLRARGNLAGVYASTLCNTGLNDFLSIPNVPDVIWPARWYHGFGMGYYDPNASVWNLGSCVPNTVWANHQRVRQYEGAHQETWGNLTLEIDSNVLDGVVAIPNTFLSAAEPVSPKGNIGTNINPTYTWNVVADSEWYYLWVNAPSGTGFIKQWYRETDVCGATTCSATAAKALGPGAHTWYIQTWNSSGGFGPWSSGMAFTVTTPPLPSVSTLVSPNGSTTDATPTYTWDEVADATQYYLWVNAPSGTGYVKQWYQASAVCNNGTCSVENPTALQVGSHTWYIRTWNAGGYGPWSTGRNFTVNPPGVASLVSPNTTTNDNTPTYTWDEVEGAEWYYLWVNAPSGNGFIKQWFKASEICTGGTCRDTPATALNTGSHTWYIRTWSTAGYGPWSSGMNFSIVP